MDEDKVVSESGNEKSPEELGLVDISDMQRPLTCKKPKTPQK